jgi:hypothetical protein
MSKGGKTIISFLIALFFFNFLFGYAIFSDLSSGSHELTQEKVYSIVAVSLAIVLGAVAVISLSLLRHGYTLKDIRRIHRILKDEDLKRHQNSMAKLKWGLVDDILYIVLAANVAILFSAHFIIINTEIITLIATFAMMMSGVMFYTPLIFLVLYPIGKILEEDFPFDSPIFFFSFGFVCLILTLASFEKLEDVWWDPIAVSVSWIAVGVVSIFKGRSRKLTVFAFVIWFTPMIVALLRYGPVVIVPYI